ncbi:FkbM family methyltransferase [Aquabacterium sp. A7-Y]|uniref:FkbM family methyltransferase n=1 Tax=Aquabacterium sp. A7-Y TaxID=1349605 RepID=UPI00223DD897|nr:FkbM family methyltransferase [Aquabacterium sp. A7-Y]MCW7536476.1 FkbM family methyltransferase [Aquabacterium sp. A7-Y]
MEGSSESSRTAIGGRAGAPDPARGLRVRAIGRAQLLRQFLLTRLTHRISRSVRAKGYPMLAVVPSDAVGQQIFADGLYEEDLLLALFDVVLAGREEAFRRGVALDVGANVGNHSLFFARRFAHVIAFEPNPPVVKILEANIDLNDAGNVTVVPVGLADASCNLSFVQDNSGNLGGSGFVAGGAAPRSGRERVLPVRVGDAELRRLGLELPVKLLKIDVEGHELAVLRGLQDRIEADAPLILFESNRATGPGGGSEVVAWLRRRGYAHIYSVGRRWEVPPRVRGVPKLRGLIELLIGCARGGHFWLEEVDRLEERAYSLLLASREPVAPPGLPPQ